jgi:hypothetical protein
VTSETEIVRQVILSASKRGDRIWRQNSGQGWIGKSRVNGSTVIIDNARPFHSGFPGWSDTGGYVMITVTPDMVGRKIPVCAQIEVKTATGRIRPEQQKFIDHILSVGGIAGVVRSVKDLEDLINGYN